jgi:predicted transcriptional regulator
MTIELKPEIEALIRKRLDSGAFSDIEEVLLQALESQDAEEAWMDLHRQEVGAKIDRAIAQAERGEAMTPEQCQAWLEDKKATWRTAQRP